MATPTADSHDLIRVQGARENNLKDVDIELPKRRLTVFTGVSGSGKSSLVFSTIAAESQRLINETYSTFVQGFMPTLNRADYDVLEGITPAIVVDQERMGANARSTVGTVTDANAMLRVLFSRLGSPYIGPPTAFSFNVPTRKASGVMSTEKAGGRVEKNVVRQAIYLGGMCAELRGPRHRSPTSTWPRSSTSRSRSSRARSWCPATPPTGGWSRRTRWSCQPTYRSSKLTKAQRDDLLYGETRKVKVEKINITYEGLIPKIHKSMFSKDVDSLQPHIKAFVERAAVFGACPNCDGTRLNESAQVVDDRGHQHRRRVRDADHRRRGVAPQRSTTRAWRRWSPTCSTCSTRSSRSVSATSRSTGPRAASPAARRSAPR